VVLATIDAGTGRPRAPRIRPTAAPNNGPSTTFCGRTPSSPASAPVAVPTETGPALVARPTTQPSGPTSAALTAMRFQSGGSSPTRCRRRATRSELASPIAPTTAPIPAARQPRCAVQDTPAPAPISPEKTTAPFGLGVLARCRATPRTY